MSPLLHKVRVLAAKIESEVGTAIELAAADAAMNVFDAMLQPEIEFIERGGQGAFSPRAGRIAEKVGTLTFTTNLHGSGSDEAPDPFWLTNLLSGCGYKESTNVWAPCTEAPGTNTKTLTMAIYQNGRVKKLSGCVGSAVLRLVAGRPVEIDWTFRGTWEAPADVAILAPDYPVVAPLIWAGSTWSFGSVTDASEITIDLGNQITPRLSGTDAAGIHSMIITGRRITGSINMEAALVAGVDQHSKLVDFSEQALSIELGSAGGNTITLAAPKAQVTNIQEADRDGIEADVVEFQCNRSADAGDDEFTITFT